ncbi:hypothetical protein GCM10011376_08640 [Nocardioides flavus (ex Wang et al. 2016)]|uniref:Uncharacterized protein n=1 Tax=Nocardioides flavus (ex Wang et al. 2016) TaxID=2058780 RepID=A0ABQ3HHT7_9ACTN|nr:hypothetical protein [Nocardioides flavus (ex Wang et al. 2016)]GHE16254.1 hypothetical protein GCM10011376_08640 [Nocardioides flavus (ex Wang et al. 2016)]
MTAMETEAWDDESWDDEAWDDESLVTEAWDDESEFLGTLLGGPAQLIGNAIGGLFGSKPTPKPPLPAVNVGVPGRGVSTATLNTPAGNATLRLPEPVVTRQEFEAGIRKLQDGINRDAARVNTLSKDLDTLRTRVGAVVVDTQKDIAKLRADSARSRVSLRRHFAKLKADQSQQQMMTMVMSMMATRSAQDALEDHTHPIASGATVTGSANVDDDSDSSMMMMLPLMMSGGGSSSDSMLPIAMMMAFR